MGQHANHLAVGACREGGAPTGRQTHQTPGRRDKQNKFLSLDTVLLLPKIPAPSTVPLTCLRVQLGSHSKRYNSFFLSPLKYWQKAKYVFFFQYFGILCFSQNLSPPYGCLLKYSMDFFPSLLLSLLGRYWDLQLACSGSSLLNTYKIVLELPFDPF